MYVIKVEISSMPNCVIFNSSEIREQESFYKNRIWNISPMSKFKTKVNWQGSSVLRKETSVRALYLFCLPFKMLDPEFHWLRQIATTLRKFHWRFLDAIAKAKN